MISNTGKGYILGAAASITYGMNPLFVLPLYENGMDADSVLFFRYFFGVVVFGEELTPREFTGLMLIILAVTAVVAGGKISHPLTRFRKLFPKHRSKV